VKNEMTKIKVSAFRWVPPLPKGWFVIFGYAASDPPYQIRDYERGAHL
jgi:hypothetical protein